jgi:hypothetical protein
MEPCWFWHFEATQQPLLSTQFGCVNRTERAPDASHEVMLLNALRLPSALSPKRRKRKGPHEA